MKCTVIIDDKREEEVVIYTHKKTKLTDEIERLVLHSGLELTGFKDREALKLVPAEVFCFEVKDNKIYALTNDDRLLLKCRLYQLEESLPGSFVKINQSCIVNVKEIKKFDASLSGTLKVTLTNGYTDYVSRRQLKNVKERLGL